MKRLHYFVPTLVVIIIGAGFYFWPSTQPVVSSVPANVGIGKDYYVFASLIELTEHNSEGEPWDSYNETGPDIFYEIFWKDTRIFKSSKKEDSFVARWTSAGIDLRDMAIGNSTASLDGVIQAARINIRENEKIQLRVHDSDVIKNDLAGEFEYSTTELKPGDTTYEYPTPGVRRLTLRVIDMQEPIDVSK